MSFEIISIGTPKRKYKSKEPEQDAMIKQEIQPEESWIDWIQRVGAGTAAEALKKIGSTPRNLLESAGGLAEYTLGSPENTKVGIPSDIVEQYSTPEQRKILEEAVRKQYDKPSGGLSPIGQVTKESLPSEESIENIYSQMDTEGYRNPRSNTEKFIQEVGSDIASLMVPLGPLGGGVGAKKAFAQSGIGNTAKWIAKSLGASEGTQEKIKAGTMFLTSFGMQDSLKNKAQSIYDQVEKDIKPNETIAMPSVRKSVNKISEEILHGGTPLKAKKYLKEQVDAIRNAFAGDQMDLKNAWQTSRDLGRFTKEVGANTPEGVMALKLQKEISDAVQKGPNKIVAKGLKDANNLWRGYKDSYKTINWIGKQLKKKGNWSTGILASVINPLIAKAGTAATVIGVPTAYAANIAKTILTNPTVGKEWANTMAHAVKENSAAFARSLNRLENKLEKTIKDQSGMKKKVEPMKSQGRFEIVSIGRPT